MAADPASVGDLGAYAGEVLRVIDGDTVEARVNVWLGHQIVTHVRLRGVDAPELNAACAEERTRALAAREALAAFAAGRRVTFSAVGPDKYFGRVVASLADEGGRDAAATLVAQGHVRRYDGRARRGWCG
ncbi:hypothetical protein QNA08_16240 [Chelatococcus sp. SYSU_G07232]|uniref:TNase-like domain-containing protein n=1 Tax=Chelatococcus albus TaxID=3047466 RepID=A0ABT7AL03_9HYPH|nr:thermonuclease family protein [Chelatococcus sp. SYSU_G07232]MDJ1159775.1 hypothetical protein [Chelatococcus sp. SYSU_G07232]